MIACRSMRIDRLASTLLLLAAFVSSLSACGRRDSRFVNSDDDPPPTPADATAGVDIVTTPADTGGPPANDVADTGNGKTDEDTSVAPPDAGPAPVDVGPSPAAGVVVGTWNLHNFSKYGDSEFRIDEIAGKIEDLAADVLAVQELKVKDGTDGSGTQAWDVLLDELGGYDGVHADWNTNDSTVGLIYDTSTTNIDDWRVLFEGDWFAFPRPPLEVELTVTRGGASTSFTVIVLHLKAFKDSVDRRRAACEALDEHMQGKPAAERRFVVIGDYNDDPYDPPDKNSFVDTFLDATPKYYFVSAALPLGSVTSTGYGTSVNGQWQDGEFLDHAVLTGELYDSFGSVTPEILGVPASQFDSWGKEFSDHFPLLVHLEP